MPITFQPKPRTIVYCDFAGYIEPEIVKRRPVIVLAVHKRNSRLVAVVPLSTTRPDPVDAIRKGVVSALGLGSLFMARCGIVETGGDQEEAETGVAGADKSS